MKVVVLLTVLGALCVLTEGAHILPQKDFDLQRFAGKWHRVGLAYNSDWFRQYRDSLKISVGVLVPTETGSVNVTMWQLKSSGCHSVTFLYEKTDTPGHFKYFSTRSNALKDITIVDTNYDEYALVLKSNPTGNTQVAMYGRKQKLRAELMEKFKAFSLAQGLPEDSIVIPLAAEDCP
ncbi:prostaglandin-H2 D-isomerase [Acipenser ruthenus]|uniref:prostaglandin-H2 D-isomerase n=1 Tax=Acipenser ruthenus TaxID=7906 RepID=UPI0027428080|nr:prostaglandin-H2 D-isomerase [Acipenser ruthenus]XP_058861508.1 prostaglandin-H2 D-isomerase [Acipenser ruthenus]